MPLVPCTGIFLGPSKSGKTVALISLILEQYRGVFERIYVFSPSVNIDDGWIPVKKYIEGDLGVNTEREQTYWDEWDEAALRRIIQQQRKITEASKKLEMKKLYQVLVVIDDFADTPQLHKPHGALDTLFIRGRRMQISTWVSSQKLRLISAAVRVNMQFLCCWRLRNQHELDAVIEELSALLPKEQLYRLCEQATREPYSFLFVYYLKPRNEMFYKRFEERFALEKDADGSGALLHLRRSRPAARRPNGRLPKEKDNHDLRGQPQESGRLGQQLRGRPGAVPAPAERRPACRLQDPPGRQFPLDGPVGCWRTRSSGPSRAARTRPRRTSGPPTT